MSISLIKLIGRYNIAKKFNYKISLDDIELSDDVKQFISTHDIIINKSKTELKFTDEYRYIHIVNSDKLQKIIIQDYNSSLLGHEKCSYRFLKNNIIMLSNIFVSSNAGVYLPNIKYIWLNLNAMDRDKGNLSIQERACLTISHEFMHYLLNKNNRETGKNFDNIAKRLRNEGYGV